MVSDISLMFCSVFKLLPRTRKFLGHWWSSLISLWPSLLVISQDLSKTNSRRFYWCISLFFVFVCGVTCLCGFGCLCLCFVFVCVTVCCKSSWQRQKKLFAAVFAAVFKIGSNLVIGATLRAVAHRIQKPPDYSAVSHLFPVSLFQTIDDFSF